MIIQDLNHRVRGDDFAPCRDKALGSPTSGVASSVRLPGDQAVAECVQAVVE